MRDETLGKVYGDGEVIVRQGDKGDRMFVVQKGRLSVTCRGDGGVEVQVRELREGDFFGEMAIIEGNVRSATVRAIGEVSLLSIDKKNFLRRVHEDPSLAYRILEKMCNRVRELTAEVARLRGS